MNKTKTQATFFCPTQPHGAVSECHALFHITDTHLSFTEQLDSILEAMAAFLADSPTQTPIFRRFFLSDASNQQALLEERLEHIPFCATSIIQQPPLDGTKIALWLYSATDLYPEYGTFTHNGYTHYWLGGAIPYSRAGISSLGAKQKESNSEHQMKDLFDTLFTELKPIGMTIEENCLRTWIFVRDIDVNYGGVVIGRRKYFQRIGLTPKTHFIASTGIEGRHYDTNVLVQMDAYSAKGFQEGQVRHLYALSHLSPTYDYGVTFERGTAVTYGDRRHIFISGTASIDEKGNVLYIGDIAQQTSRMLENISALLSEANADFSNIAIAFVYLRDVSDADIVRTIFAQRLPDLHYELVLAPVCRPTWLIEMECIAITDCSYPEYNNY